MLCFRYFFNQNNIEKVCIFTPTPNDQPYFRTDVKKNLNVNSIGDYSVLLTVEQAEELTDFVENGCEAFFENSTIGNSNGAQS